MVYRSELLISSFDRGLQDLCKRSHVFHNHFIKNISISNDEPLVNPSTVIIHNQVFWDAKEDGIRQREQEVGVEEIKGALTGAGEGKDSDGNTNTGMTDVLTLAPGEINKSKEVTQRSQYYPDTSASTSSLLANLFFLGASAGLFFISSRLIYGKFTSVISKDATINGIVIDLKTPSSGKVSQLTKETGKKIVPNELIAVLENERASQLQIQQLTTQLNKQQKELESAQAHLSRQISLLKTLEIDLQNQHNLQVRQAHYQVMEASANLEEAQAKYQLAQKKYNRANFLAQEGAISKESSDLALAELQQTQAEMKHWQARLQQFSADEKAAQLDLFLRRNNSNYDPKIRHQELQIDINNQRETIHTLQQTIKGTQSQLAAAQKDFKQKEKVTITASTSGVMWRLDTRSGEFVEKGQSLGAMLDCNRRWVDVYVEERALRSLQPGMLAIIKPYGTKKVFQGRIVLIRSGLGRLRAGEDVAIPWRTNSPRQSQVRVEFEPGTETGAPEQFCYFGYTARVIFKVR